MAKLETNLAIGTGGTPIVGKLKIEFIPRVGSHDITSKTLQRMTVAALNSIKQVEYER